MASRYSELISIPESVNKGDFVLKLAEGVTEADATLASYVVTPQLAAAFGEALGLVATCAGDGKSRAAYLHGSFGSGKSHFMAVLHLVLNGHARALAVPELAAPIAKHRPSLQGKKFLLVPYHLIGSRTMEQAILGRYVDFVRKLHPGAPTPGVFLAEKLFEDAVALRAKIGDELFFRELNGGAAEMKSRWGSLAADWTPERFARALEGRARTSSDQAADPDRTALVGALIDSYFGAYDELAAVEGESYVDLDKGLAVIAEHAKSLGYDGLVLFLDELVLWLASHVADMKWVEREATKLPKLVEAETTRRAIPIMSFIARQRDLRDLVGEHVAGNEKLSFSDSLKHWEGRFDVIPLEDRNLPLIAEKRLLQPASEAARTELDRAFEPLKRVALPIRQTLLGDKADLDQFRRTLPFPPVLIDVLVALSSALQRERTALRVMLQLLVNHRDSLTAGRILPLGDVFDVLKEGDEPLTSDLKRAFEAAKSLHAQQLLPQLEARFGVRMDEVQDGKADPDKARNLVAADRVVKTVLMAALTPDLPALSNLTASRLAALHYGWIPTGVIPGQEAKWVIDLFRSLAAQVGQVKLGGETVNPTVQIQLVGVDIEGILDRAAAEDTPGSRQKKVRELVFAELGVDEEDAFVRLHKFLWRGTRRQCEVVFGNVRALPEDVLRPEGDDWKLVIDFPFDQEGYGPQDDVRRVETVRSGGRSSRSLCWIPDFFGQELLRDLGTLVKIDRVLLGDGLERNYGAHLSVADRASAKILLDNRRRQLNEKLRQALAAAYGMPGENRGGLEGRIEPADRLQSLDPSFAPQRPAGPSLRDALQQVLDQALSHQFPMHPDFDTKREEKELTKAELRRMLEVFRAAVQSPNRRITVEQSIRPLVRRIAEPLRLGQTGEDAFVAGPHWTTELAKHLTNLSGPLTVKELRRGIDHPVPLGFPREVQNLVILAYAELTQRTPVRQGIPFDDADVDDLPDDVELREQQMPDEGAWSRAIEIAAHAFGLSGIKHRTAATVARFVAQVKEEARRVRKAANDLLPTLRAALESADLGADVARMKTARSAVALVEAILDSADDRVVAALAEVRPGTTWTAVGSSLKQAAAMSAALSTSYLKNALDLRDVQDERKPDAERILAELREVLAADEYQHHLGAALESASNRAFALFKRSATAPTTPVKPSSPPPRAASRSPLIEKRWDMGGSAAEVQRDVESLLEQIKRNPKSRLYGWWRLEHPENGS